MWLDSLTAWLWSFAGIIQRESCPRFHIGGDGHEVIPAIEFCQCQGMKVERQETDNEFGGNLGYLDSGNWVLWNVQVSEEGSYRIRYRLSSLDGHGGFSLWANGIQVASVVGLPKTGGWHKWDDSFEQSSVVLVSGEYALRIQVEQAGWNLQALEIMKQSTERTQESAACPSFYLQPNTSVVLDESTVCDEHRGSVGFQEDSVRDGRDRSYPDFLQEDDWLEWDITFTEGGTYMVHYTVASADGDGAFQVSSNSGVLPTWRDIPTTESWDNYARISQRVGFAQGNTKLRLRVVESGWTLRSIEIVGLPHDYIRAMGTELVHGSLLDPEPILLRGMGLGGWMFQEPYMMLSEATAQFEIFENIQELIGVDGFREYHQKWLDEWMTREDVQVLKRAGFNMLRVALHYNLFTRSIQEEEEPSTDTWLDDGFDRLDALVGWCEEEEIYLIIDMHAAPGGQGLDAAISDYDSEKPNMWEDKENVRKTVALWGKLADRYKYKTWIAGYDLLNEPNFKFEEEPWLNPNGCEETTNTLLRDYYVQTIATIREVDPFHAMFIQGNCWANNHDGLWPFDDDNLVLTFHHYWVPNELDSIQPYLELREEHQVPLWMGEAGENDNEWYKEAVQLLESNNIGWSWWTHKKLQSTTGAFSIDAPERYDVLLQYWYNDGQAPEPEVAKDILLQLAGNARLENVHRNRPALQALTGYTQDCGEGFFAEVTPTGKTRIQAEMFCKAHAADTEDCSDNGGGRNVLWTKQQGWIAHNVRVIESGLFELDLRIASLDGDGAWEMRLDDVSGEIVARVRNLVETDGWQTWTTTALAYPIYLPAGEYTVYLKSLARGWNLNWYELNPIGDQ